MNNVVYVHKKAVENLQIFILNDKYRQKYCIKKITKKKHV